jgi:hypothetical protein
MPFGPEWQQAAEPVATTVTPGLLRCSVGTGTCTFAGVEITRANCSQQKLSRKTFLVLYHLVQAYPRALHVDELNRRVDSEATWESQYAQLKKIRAMLNKIVKAKQIPPALQEEAVSFVKQLFSFSEDDQTLSFAANPIQIQFDGHPPASAE